MDPEHSSAAASSGTDAKPADQAEPSAPDRQDGLFGRIMNWTARQADPEPEENTSSLERQIRALPPAERLMVSNILRLDDIRVEDVMTPRADVVAVAEDASLGDVIAAFERGSISRLPVYRDTLDEPIGFVHVKDLALSRGFGRNGAREFRIADYLRTALFVPPSMRIAALLQKMQADRVHMALVIDEFGGVDGLVTIEDLIEQVVGNIEDEHDTGDGQAWTQESEGVWLAQARADIDAFQEAEGLDLLPPEWVEDVDTIGGLVFMLANRVPTRGEVITHPTGYEFEIVDADARRIKRVRVRAANGRSVLGQAAE